MPITLEELERKLKKQGAAIALLSEAVAINNELAWKEKDALMGQLAKIEGQLKEQDSRLNRLEELLGE